MTDVSTSLGRILDHLIQNTYCDLSLLREILPQKSDRERKIKLAQFAKKTKHQFVRLLALANWASAPETSNSLATFTANLDQQSRLYIDTANQLLRQEKEILRLLDVPQFSIVSAIEILRTGNFSFLPTCISSNVKNLPPFSNSEKLSTLHKLDQTLRLRLIHLLPNLPHSITPHLNLFPKGCLTMHVNNEFNARLTIMGENTEIPWRLIQLDFLIRNHHSFDNRPLVHSNQKLYLHKLVQSRLFIQDNNNVLTGMYQLLHSFCTSLQLQVLYTQLIQLTKHWGKHSLGIEEYIPGEKLRIAYWCSSPMYIILDMHNSITVSSSTSQPNLLYYHTEAPTSSSDKSDANNTSGQSSTNPSHKGKLLDPESLFVDSLIYSCIEIKCLHALQTIKKCLNDKRWPYSIQLHTSPPVVLISLGFNDIYDTLEIMKDPRNGKLQCIIRDFNICNSLEPNNSTLLNIQTQLDDLAKALFDNVTYAAELLTHFRAQFRLWHYEQQAIEMGMPVSSKLPLLNGHILSLLSQYKERERDCKVNSFYFLIYIKLKTPNYYLMVSVTPDLSTPYPSHIVEDIYLLLTQSVHFSSLENQNPRVSKNKINIIYTGNYSEGREEKLLSDSKLHLVTPHLSFLTVRNILKLRQDHDVATVSSYTFIIPPMQKRRIQSYGANVVYFPHTDLFQKSTNFYDLFQQLDILISLFQLEIDLNQEGCSDYYISTAKLFDLSPSLIIFKLPCPNCVSKVVYRKICKQLSFCRFNLIPNKHWIVQLALSPSYFNCNESFVNLTYPFSFNSSTVFERFYTDWEAILMLFGSVMEYHLYLGSSDILRKYSKITSYSYNRLTLSYSSEDINQSAQLEIFWHSNTKRFQLLFINGPHSFAQTSFEDVFNAKYSLPQLLFGLIKLFPLYRLIEQTMINFRKYQAGPNPAIIRLGFKIAIYIEYCHNNTIIIHPYKPDSVERVFALLEKFIDLFEDTTCSDLLDAGSLQIPAITRSISLSAASPGFSLKPFSPASTRLSLSQTPYTTTKASPFFPSLLSVPQQQFFSPNTWDSNYSHSTCVSPTKTVNFSTFKLIMSPSKKKLYLPPLSIFLGAANLLDYERLVKFGNLPTLDHSRIKLEADSFLVQFDYICVSVHLESTFMDLGVKLSHVDNGIDQAALNTLDIQALEMCFHSSKIKSPQFSNNALSCYLKLMSSPLRFLQTAAFIIRQSRNTPTDWLWQPELCLTTPDNSQVKPQDDLSASPGHSCLFILPNKCYVLYIRFSPLKQKQGPILDLVLLYDYKHNKTDLKTHGISDTGRTPELIVNAINKILARVNSCNESDCSLLLAVEELSKKLEI